MLTPRIEVEGWREFQRNVSRAADRDLPKRIGQAHKRVGQLVVSRLSPRPTPATVGQGAGAAVRPSATRREVILRVGGAHRAERASRRDVELRVTQWGRQETSPESGRPHIIGTAHQHQDDIERMLLDEIERALKPAFA